MKRWQCIVCGYVYVGAEPPEKCPVCGAGVDYFKELQEILGVKAFNNHEALQEVLFQVPCGLFVVTGIHEEKPNGMINNTVFQITDDPLQLLLGMNKSLLTTEYIQKSGVFGIIFLTPEQLHLVKRFGFQSGREIDKFQGLDWYRGVSGAPLLKECSGYIEGRIKPEQTMDAGTHLVFLGEVLAGDFQKEAQVLSYQEYRKRKAELWQ